MTSTTDTDRYAQALATIGMQAAGLSIEAERAQDTDRGLAARLEDKAAGMRAILLEVIYADLVGECPLLDPDERRTRARRERGRVLRDSRAQIRGGR